MDVEKTIEFLLQHQARMAAENELFHLHQAEVRAEHEARFGLLEVAQLELAESLSQISKRIDSVARLLSDSLENQERVGKANREEEARYREQEARYKEQEASYKEKEARYKVEQQELHKHMDERLNALIQIIEQEAGHKEKEARYKEEQQELHKHMDERLNALIQIIDEIIRRQQQ